MTSRLGLLMASSAIGLALAATQGAALAQSSGAASTQLPAVQVQGDKPADTTTLDRNQIVQEGGNSLDDLLRGVSGVFTRETSQQPGVAVNIRGFEGQGRVNMMIDGVRQSFRFTGHEAAGFTYVDPNLLAGIDITRGAVLDAGGGALAGTVNFRTLGVDDVVAPGRSFGALSRLSWGSNGVGFQEMLAAGARIGGTGVMGAISQRNSDNYHDGYGNSVAGSGQELTSGLVKMTTDLGGGHSLGLGAVIYDNDFYANSFYQTVNNKTFTANYRYNPGNNLIDLRVNAAYNDLVMKYTDGATKSTIGRVIEDKGAGFDVSNLSTFTWGPFRVRSNNGMEYFHDEVSSENGGVNPADGTSSLLGVFTDTTFSYGIFDLTPGLRYNRYTLDGSSQPSRTASRADVDLTKDSLDPKLTLAANVTSWLQPYVTWSRSMRAPTLQETMLGGDHPGNTSASFIPNANLRPETQQGWEFGVNVNRHGLWRADDVFTARANYFMMDVDDYIVARYVSSARAYRYENVTGTSKVSGFELEMSYDPRIVFARASFTHTNSDLATQQPGAGASQYLPDNIGSVTFGARFLDERLTVGSRYDYVSDGKQATFTGTTTQGGKPYHLLGLFASAKVTENVEVNARVTNLMDVAYTPFLSTIGTGQGRTIYLGTEIRF
ncbi:TonB-dependent receptor [Roseomonas sp. GC11]|uniref:TonB-dependent receptor domain-containing protein n=1 Tax=Roseomonas sp. GC11 TaxID=2950546 RepID=UPI00210C1544|nr:TonB-dependent receptor [Roseomonas sp. GC11]MCQ4160364.1 TonB-dependent receptor [Roseomonas sp. GC11]